LGELCGKTLKKLGESGGRQFLGVRKKQESKKALEKHPLLRGKI